jgi:hypothetical protein
MTVILSDSKVFRGGGRVIAVALGVAAVGLVGFIVGLILDPQQALASFLIAYFYAVTVVIGLLAFVMGGYAMNAKWPTAVRRVAEMGFSTMPLLLLLYLPLFWSARLYPWAHPERVAEYAARQIVLHKQPVMNAPFFYVRAIVFLVYWTVVAELLRRWSLRMDVPEPPNLKDRLRMFSSVALPFVGLTGTVAAFDWVMSLSPDFYSTMYGLYVLSGGFVASIGLMAVMVTASRRAGFLAGIKRSHWYALGRLLFAFLIFWAYTGFFQYLLIWIANKPVEARFYLERFQSRGLWVSWFLAIGHFLVPWLLLLSYSLKRNAASVTGLGAWILFCHYVDVHWLVGADRGGTQPWRWEDLPAVLLVGGLLVAFAAWRQRGHMLSAFHDPDYAAGVAYESR